MIKNYRLDYRLLHGQVVFAWTQNLGVQRIIVVDDDAATNELKKTALNLSKPAGVRLNIFQLSTALSKMKKVEELHENIMMIFGNTKTLLEFCKAYPKCKEVNYGGIANKESSKQYAAAVFLDESEQSDTQALLDLGIKIYMQQTPSTRKDNLTAL